MTNANADNGVYYFLGNITSHILHALPLYKKLGGTFVVLSKKAKQEVEKYNVPVINIDNAPRQWQRFGYRIKPVYHYLAIDKNLKKTVDFLNENARVVIFYELYEFAPSVRLTKPKTIFLTHGNMLKDYMASNNRLETIRQYDYMAALGPSLKRKFITEGIDPKKLVDIGIARTDEIVAGKGKVVLPDSLVNASLLDPKKKIFSYLPTFWGASTIYNLGKELVRNFPDNYTLLFRPHPQTPDRLLQEYFDIIATKPGNILYVPEGKYPGVGLTEVMSASSAIIGDVSSVMLEAILLDKPMIFCYGAGQHRQSDSDYESIKKVVSWSEYIDENNMEQTSKILARALKKGIDGKIWKASKDTNFYNWQGNSVPAIANFIKSIV